MRAATFPKSERQARMQHDCQNGRASRHEPQPYGTVMAAAGRPAGRLHSDQGSADLLGLTPIPFARAAACRASC